MNQFEVQAEFSVIGALLIDNDAIDRIPYLKSEYFYNNDNRLIFIELKKQIVAGSRADVITVFDKLKDRIPECLILLNSIANSVGSSSNILKYSEIIEDKAIKRALVMIGREIEDVVATGQNSAACVDLVASKIDALIQRQTIQEPNRLDDMLGDYVTLIEDRHSGKIKPIATGYAALDEKLGGGIDRGTVTVVAGRPAMGKTAYGLGIARNVSEWGTSLFLSMEMPKEQVCDRNISALGKIPLSWLRRPNTGNPLHDIYWNNLTVAFQKAQELNLYIDDQTSLNVLAIRNKARKIKRIKELDLLVIDQLSFITGSESDQLRLAIGEYTRGLLQIAKELQIAVVLLCQLNRECEKRQDKRPIMSDLAESGSIEQDASTIIFLYRDEVYNPDSPDQGIAEIIIKKQRQGLPGIVGMVYIGEQTRFEDVTYGWKPTAPAQKTYKKGLANHL